MTSETITPKNWSMISSFLGVKGGAWLIAWLASVDNPDWLASALDAGDGATTVRSALIGIVGLVSGLLAGKGTQAGSIGGKTKEKRNAKKARQEWVDNQIEKETQ